MSAGSYGRTRQWKIYILTLLSFCGTAFCLRANWNEVEENQAMFRRDIRDERLGSLLRSRCDNAVLCGLLGASMACCQSSFLCDKGDSRNGISKTWRACGTAMVSCSNTPSKDCPAEKWSGASPAAGFFRARLPETGERSLPKVSSP